MAEASGPRRLVAGNWKMNHKGGLLEVRKLKEGLRAQPARCEVAICPPATLLASIHGDLATNITLGRERPGILLGGQDCHPEPSGAFTGDISAEALKDAGASLVILGHSERRHGHGESDELVCRKVKAALRARLIAIVCVGETESQRDQGATLKIVGRQLAHSIPQDMPAVSLVVAYEPVWAIGTGRVPSNGDIQEVHGFIRAELTSRLGAPAGGVPILYGGSVKPDNAAEILRLKHVDGALVGGASLNAEDFLAIIAVA